MAVIDIKEGYTGEEASGQSDDGKTGTRDASRVFSATVSDPVNDTVDTVKRATGIPRIRDPHPVDSYMRCRRVRVNRESPIFFKIFCDYQAPTYTDDENPLDKPAEISYGDASTVEPIDCDVNGAPICTVNGESFDPPVTREYGDMTLTVVRNQATFDAIGYSAFKNTTNSTAFLGWPTGTVRCFPILGQSVSDGNFDYWVATFMFAFRRGAPLTTDERAWWKRIRHEGFKEKVTFGASSKIVHATDEKRQPTTVPVLLDVNGVKITDPTLAVWLEFQVFASMDLNALYF